MLSSQLKLKICTNPEDFATLKSSWNKLATSLNDNFFYRHEWFDAAWQWRKQNSQLNILCFYHNNILVGILPLIIESETKRNLKLKQLAFLSIPDTQVCDFIINPKYQQIIFEQIKHYLTTNRNWDKLNLHYLPSESQVLAFKYFLTDNSLKLQLDSNINHPIIEINQPWQDYYAGLSRRLKKGNNSVNNRLKKHGAVKIVKFDHKSDTKKILSIITDISKNSWKSTTETTFDNSGPKKFIQRLTQLGADNEWLACYVLYLDSSALAMEYHIKYNNHIYALRSDFIQSAQDLSAGTYLNWKIIEQLFADINQIYFMGPGENKYKLRWKNRLDPVFTLVGFNKTVKGMLLNIMENKIAPSLRPLKAKLQNSSQEENL